jgi:hypothetical protein
MFPEVFGVSRTDLQLSAFYETSRAVRSKPTNAEQPPKPSAAVTTCAPTNSTHASAAEKCRGVLSLPPMRRVVKLSIQPNAVAWVVGTIGVVNVLAFVHAVSMGHGAVAVAVVGQQPAGVFWGLFLYLWTLVACIQLVVCSVYICTPFAVICVMSNLVVVLGASLIHGDLFSHIWVAPALCTVFVSHQCHLMWLVRAQSPSRKLYIAVAVGATLLPLTQLFRDPAEVSAIDASAPAGISTRDLTFSAMSMAALYMTALFNCSGAVVVDLTIGTSPLWVAGEAD